MADAALNPEITDWILSVYAEARLSIVATLAEAGAADPDRLAGAILARLVNLDPPLTIERLSHCPGVDGCEPGFHHPSVTP